MGFWMRDTGYEIRDTGYGIRDTGYGINCLTPHFVRSCGRLEGTDGFDGFELMDHCGGIFGFEDAAACD